MSMYTGKVVIAACFLAACLFPFRSIADDDVKARARSIIAEIRTLLDGQEKRGPKHEESWSQAMKKAEELGALGEDAVSEIPMPEEPDSGMRRVFIRCLGSMKGEKSGKMLFKCLPSAEWEQVSRELLGRPIDFKVPKKSIDFLMKGINEDDATISGTSARILAACRKNDITPAVDLILDKYYDAVLHPYEGQIFASYVSGRVYVLNQYLLVFGRFGERVVPALREKLNATKDSPEMTKWLQIALGYAGDKSVAPDVKLIAEHDPDKYVRWCGINAYAGAAKEEAIPFLETFANDETRSDYEQYYLLLQKGAKGAISSIRHPDGK